MTFWDKIRNAKQFAVGAHGDQKYGVEPYIFHLNQVYDVANSFSASETIQIATYLHDILEDTEVEVEGLVKSFGIDIAHLVWCVTDEPGKNRAERHKKTYPKIRTRLDAVELKLYDRIANITYSLKTNNHSLIEMYHKEYSEFRQNLEENCLVFLWDRLEVLDQLCIKNLGEK